MAETITFNGVDPTTVVSGLSITGTDPHRPADRTLNAAALANSNRSSVASAFNYDRKIHVLASLQAASKALLQTQLRLLESVLQTKEGLLVLSVAGVPTQFTATKDNIMTSYLAGGLAELDIEFFCSDPMGYAVSSTTLYSYAHLVGGAYSFAVTWQGNVKQQPVVTITVNTLTGTSNMITIGNPTTGESVTVQRGWSAADILIVDSKNKTVTVNGVDTDYSGKIPEWSASQPITYSDDFTARNIAASVTYQVRNL